MHESNGFGLSLAVKQLRAELLKKGFDKATIIVSDLKKKDPEYVLKEDDLNSYGYRLIGEGKKYEGLSIFKLNVDLYPESANVYDSYAEALSLIGYQSEAVKNYKRSLELNPQNNNAADQLQKLQKK